MNKKIEKIRNNLDLVAESHGINLYAESSLHKSLKLIFSDEKSRFEAKIDGKIVDSITNNCCIEVQLSGFGSIKKKIIELTHHNDVVLIHPLYVKSVIETWNADKTVLIRSRKSPKKENLYNMFDELVYAPEFVNLSRFTLRLVLCEIKEIRLLDGKGSFSHKNISKFDRELIKIVDVIDFFGQEAYLQLVPFSRFLQFTNSDLSDKLKITIPLATKMSSCLRKSGVLAFSGKRGRAYLYELY